MRFRILFLASIFACSGAFAAIWQPIVTHAGEIGIDRSRVIFGGGGLVAVWSRRQTPQVVSGAEGRYNAIEALNRYDCANNRFATLKRLYLFDSIMVRAENVWVPKEMDIAAGSVEAVIRREACALSNQQQIAEASSFASGGEGAFAGTQMLAGAVAPRVIAVADTESAPAPVTPIDPATPTPALRRFITLPRPAPVQKQPAASNPEGERKKVPLEKILRDLERQTSNFPVISSGSPHRATHHDTPPKDVHWRYAGKDGPDNWAKLSPAFALCGKGKRQSPIDIQDSINVDLEPIEFSYHPSKFRIVDNGHTVQVNFSVGNVITVMGRTWRLVQLHFHQPSEDRINGQGFAMEMHLVHSDDEGRLAVVAVMLERGNEHPVIQTFWNNLPLESHAELAPLIEIELKQLLPESRTYYTYMGSLTTPPCSEGVLWMVLKQPLQVSPEQIAIFSRLYSNNARPLQPVNERLIKGNR